MIRCGPCIAACDAVRTLACLAMLLSACVVGDVKDFPNDPDPDPDPADPTPDPEPEAPTGTLKITATSSTKPGLFAPNNVVAVWIESDAGAFVKTIDRWSGVRSQYLLAWNAKAGTGDVDSVSGASRLDHATPLSITWKLKDRNKQPIADGTYTIRMESAESNSVSETENNEGTFTFVKGADPQVQTGLASGGFTNVKIEFTPPPL